MRASSNSKEIHGAVRRLRELPPLPQNGQRLLAAVTDNDIEIGSLVALIEECPAVAARIVGLAGSAFFAQPVPVRSISDAIIRVLGLNLVKILVMGITVTGGLKAENCPEFNLQEYWCGTLLTATLSRQLAPAVRAGQELDPDNAYLCGLLHNLGMLALVHVAPNEMQGIFAAARKSPQRPLAEFEMEAFGIHSGHAGVMLAHRWHLPKEVGLVMVQHQLDHLYQGPEWPLCQLVGLCARWTRQLLSGSDESWQETESVKSLGIDQEGLSVAREVWLQRYEDIVELAKLFVE